MRLPTNDVEIPIVDRLYVVGDVHGMLEHLGAMVGAILAEAEKRPDLTHAVALVGDYVDRGQDSAKCVELVRGWGPSANIESVTPIMGNHEQMLVQDVLRHSYHYKETPESYARSGRALDGDLEWMRLLPQVATCGPVIVVHAGLRVNHETGEAMLPDTDDTYLEDVLWIRPFDPAFAFHVPGRLVVHGHTPIDTSVAREGDTVNVDTACFHTGRMSCAVVDVKSASVAKVITVSGAVSRDGGYRFVGPDLRVSLSFP